MAPGRFERLDDSPPQLKRGTSDSSSLPSIMVQDGDKGRAPSGGLDYFAIKPASNTNRNSNRRSNLMSPGDEIASLFTPSPSLFPAPPGHGSENAGTNFFFSSTSDNTNNMRNLAGGGTGAGNAGLTSTQTLTSDRPLLQSPAPIYSPASSNGSFPGGDDDQATGRPTSSMAPAVPTPKTTSSSKFDFGLQLGGSGNPDTPSQNSKHTSSNLPPTITTTPTPIEPAYSPYDQTESAKTYTTFTGFRPFSIHSDTHSYIEGEEDDDFNDRGGGNTNVMNLAERGRISTGGTGISMKLRGDGVGAAEMAQRARRRRKMCIGLGVAGGVCAAAIIIGVVAGVVSMFMR